MTAAFAVVLRYLGEQIDVRAEPEPEPEPDPTAMIQS